MPFKVGDVARLKSGSPRLNITKLVELFPDPDCREVPVPGIEVIWIGYNDHAVHSLTAPAACFRSDT